MTTKPKARKFRIKRSDGLAGDGLSTATPPEAQAEPEPAADSQPARRIQRATAAQTEAAVQQQVAQPTYAGDVSSPAQVNAENDIDAIRQEGLTGRQLRMARRVAQKHGLAVTSDFDAVRQLRARGIDPFERSSILELVVPQEGGAGDGGGILPPSTVGSDGQPLGRIQLPQTIQQGGSRELGEPVKLNAAERRAGEILRIQQDIVRRRRAKMLMLGARLAVFVLLPTILTAWYFFLIATPMYATKTEFVIQQAQASGGGATGMAGLFQGTSLGTQQDATTVQSYLLSRAAMVRLDEEEGLRAHFSQDTIDPIQRLSPDASNEDLFKVYSNHVVIGYDPTEGILKMEVIAADPAASQRFSEALVGYAEEQVDQLTQRLREDQMQGALDSYNEAETRREQALSELLRIQNDVEVLSPDAEISALLTQIAQLETQRQQKVLELSTLQNVRRPNEARVNGVQAEIANIGALITDLRSQMTQTTGDGNTLATKTTELRLAEENYQFQTVMVQQAMTMMETARLEANRQVRYLSLGVEPIAPDSPTYPRAFENTLVAFLIYAGIYLMISLTASILREQVTS